MIKLINKLKNRKGFTLIELIVVLAVLAIIMAIAVPRFLGVKDQAKEDADIATLGLIAKTAEFYHAKGELGTTYDTMKTLEDPLLASLKSDFPNLIFQSKGHTSDKMENVQLQINSTTGKATAKLGTLQSK